MSTSPLWLSDFCGVDVYRPTLHRPMALELAGQKVSVATNGHRMIALFDGGQGLPAMVEPYATAVRRYLTPATNGVAVDLSEFRAFLSRTILVTCHCTACRSTGAVTCGRCDDGFSLTGGYLCTVCGGAEQVPCKACGDDGTTDTLVRIGHGVFNARLWARPLDAVAGERATWHQEDPAKAATLMGDGWTIAVMPRRPAHHAPVAAEFDSWVTR